MDAIAHSPIRNRMVVVTALFLLASVPWMLASRQVSHGEEPVRRLDSGFVTSNRTNLRICVDSKVPEISNETLSAAVNDALAKTQLHQDYAAAGLAVASPQVDVGCPGPARMIVPGFDHDDGTTAGMSSNVVVPSVYRAFVFVVPRTAATRPDNGLITRIVPQEYMCEGEVCPEVTTALYLTPEDMASPQSVAKLFAGAVGLDPDPSTPDPWK